MLVLKSPRVRSVAAGMLGGYRPTGSSAAAVAISESALESEDEASGFIPLAAALVDPLVTSLASAHGLDKSLASAVASIARLPVPFDLLR